MIFFWWETCETYANLRSLLRNEFTTVCGLHIAKIHAQLKKVKSQRLYHTPGKISKKKSSEITGTILGASSVILITYVRSWEIILQARVSFEFFVTAGSSENTEKVDFPDGEVSVSLGKK